MNPLQNCLSHGRTVWRISCFCAPNSMINHILIKNNLSHILFEVKTLWFASMVSSVKHLTPNTPSWPWRGLLTFCYHLPLSDLHTYLRLFSFSTLVPPSLSSHGHHKHKPKLKQQPHKASTSPIIYHCSISFSLHCVPPEIMQKVLALVFTIILESGPKMIPL